MPLTIPDEMVEKLDSALKIGIGLANSARPRQTETMNTLLATAYAFDDLINGVEATPPTKE